MKMYSSAPAGGRPALRVEEKEFVSEGVCRIRLVDPRGIRLADWTPGAHIDVGLPNGLVRQYSLCGDRWDPMSYEIAVLLEPESRGGSRFIHQALEVGDLLEVGGPRNNFHLTPAAHYLFVAGGIGITPLLPMIQQVEMLAVPWKLLYSGRSLASMAFLPRLLGYCERVVICARDKEPRIDLAAAVASAPHGTKVYCCGPTSMVDAMEKVCVELPSGSLRRERFVAMAQPAPIRSEPYVIELARSGREFTIRRGESILDVCVEAGVPLLASCRQGLCGTCETTVLNGVPDHRDSILSDSERECGAAFYPCVSRSASDRLVLDL